LRPVRGVIWAASPDENTPRGLNQAVRPIPGGHGTEGVPPSWSLHRVRASVWASRVQVKPPGAAGRREAVVPAGTLSPAFAALWHPGRSPSSGLGRGGARAHRRAGCRQASKSEIQPRHKVQPGQRRERRGGMT
jgi:hypothetical protein